MKEVFCSWSGGKDSCLALHRATQEGYQPGWLITMMIESGERSRSHGLRVDVVQAQAEAMDLPIITRATTWEDYEQSYINALEEMKGHGIETGVFGDIDFQPHRDWVERVCGQVGMNAILPLWNEPRMGMVLECIEAGIECRIVSCKAELMGPEYLGQTLTQSLAEELDSKGVDACGENGEFHTIVVNGPLFKYALDLESGETYEHGGHWALDYRVLQDNVTA